MRYSMDELISFSDYFNCDYILIEYFLEFISRDLLLTIKDFFKVLCHYSIDHPIVKHALLCYATTLNLDYDLIESLLHNRSFVPRKGFKPESRYAIFRFRNKLRDTLRTQKYQKRIVYGKCQVGHHQMVC